MCCDNGAGFLFLLCVTRVLLGVTGLCGQALPRPHRASYSHYVCFGCTSFRVSGPFSWLGTDRLRYLLAASRHLLSLRRECCLWLWCPVTFALRTQHSLRLFATCELISACRSDRCICGIAEGPSVSYICLACYAFGLCYHFCFQIRISVFVLTPRRALSSSRTLQLRVSSASDVSFIL